MLLMTTIISILIKGIHYQVKCFFNKVYLILNDQFLKWKISQTFLADWFD